jgi:hypothetical protein
MTSDLWFVVVVVVTGDEGEVDGQEAKLHGIAGGFGGIPGGETNGENPHLCHRLYKGEWPRQTDPPSASLSSRKSTIEMAKSTDFVNNPSESVLEHHQRIPVLLETTTTTQLTWNSSWNPLKWALLLAAGVVVVAAGVVIYNTCSNNNNTCSSNYNTCSSNYNTCSSNYNTCSSNYNTCSSNYIAGYVCKCLAYLFKCINCVWVNYN